MNFYIVFLICILISSCSYACVIDLDPHTGTYHVDQNGCIK